MSINVRRFVESARHNRTPEGCTFDLVLNESTSQWIIPNLVCLLATAAMREAKVCGGEWTLHSGRCRNRAIKGC